MIVKLWDARQGVNVKCGGKEKSGSVDERKSKRRVCTPTVVYGMERHMNGGGRGECGQVGERNNEICINPYVSTCKCQ